MTKAKDTTFSTTAVEQPTGAFKPAGQARGTPPRVSTSTGRSTLPRGPTVVVRAVPSVTVPFDVDRETTRRENREANRGERDPATDTSR